MKAKHFLSLIASSLALASASPAFAASEYPLVPGDYVDMASISIDDGHDLDYANFLAASWRKQQDFAKAQGWITDYAILANIDKRPGEPDLYLVSYFKSMPDSAEMQKRDDAFHAFMKMTDTQMQAASGQRATYRHQMGSMLLQKLEWAK